MKCPICGNYLRVMEDARESLLGLLFGCEVCNKILKPEEDIESENGFSLTVSSELTDLFVVAAVTRGSTLNSLIRRLDHMAPISKNEIA